MVPMLVDPATQLLGQYREIDHPTQVVELGSCSVKKGHIVMAVEPGALAFVLPDPVTGTEPDPPSALDHLVGTLSGPLLPKVQRRQSCRNTEVVEPQRGDETARSLTHHAESDPGDKCSKDEQQNRERSRWPTER